MLYCQVDLYHGKNKVKETSSLNKEISSFPFMYTRFSMLTDLFETQIILYSIHYFMLVSKFLSLPWCVLARPIYVFVNINIASKHTGWKRPVPIVKLI